MPTLPAPAAKPHHIPRMLSVLLALVDAALQLELLWGERFRPSPPFAIFRPLLEQIDTLLIEVARDLEAHGGYRLAENLVLGIVGALVPVKRIDLPNLHGLLLEVRGYIHVVDHVLVDKPVQS